MEGNWGLFYHLDPDWLFIGSVEDLKRKWRQQGTRYLISCRDHGSRSPTPHIVKLYPNVTHTSATDGESATKWNMLCASSITVYGR